MVVQEPKLEDPAHNKWEAKNSTLMSWLLHSMQPEISQEYLFLSTTNEMKFGTQQLKPIPKCGMRHKSTN